MSDTIKVGSFVRVKGTSRTGWVAKFLGDDKSVALLDVGDCNPTYNIVSLEVCSQMSADGSNE